MIDFTERKIGGDLAKEQPLPKKPTPFRPLPLRAQVAKVPLGPGSSFQPWQKTSGSNIDDLAKKPYHKLASSSNSHPAENDKKKHIENSSNSDQAAEDHNPTNGGGAITSIAANDDNTAKTSEAQAYQPGLGSNTESEMDKKLRRTISNRDAARRSRLKKLAYVEDLESKEQFYQEKIAALQPQIEDLKKQQQILQIEQHGLKLRMATHEKQRVVQEAAIEKNKAEVQRLREVRSKLIAEAQARMLSMCASMQMMSNSNLKYPSALNGVETSKKLVDHSPITIKSEPDGDLQVDHSPITIKTKPNGDNKME